MVDVLADLLTTDEAAAEAGVHPSLIRRHIQTKQLRARRRGHNWWIHRDDLADYLRTKRRRKKTVVAITPVASTPVAAVEREERAAS